MGRCSESISWSRRALALVRDVVVSGKLIHDANIVATMLAGGVTSLLTLDSQGFGRFGHLITLVGLPDA